MKQFHGLSQLAQHHSGKLNGQQLAERLLTDLAHCRCLIYGCIGDDDQILLAELTLLTDSLTFDSFDQRIDLIVGGHILRNDCVPLTYRLQANEFAITGRCSMIARVCGVDLYLQRSYTGQVGDFARQKFAALCEIPWVSKLKLTA